MMLVDVLMMYVAVILHVLQLSHAVDVFERIWKLSSN